jgi:hypothetical protein
LLDRENYWMNQLSSLDRSHGYNLQNATRTVISEELREKLIQAVPRGERHYNYRKHPSEETRNRMSIAHKDSPHFEANKIRLAFARMGLQVTEATRKKLSDIQKNMFPEKRQRRIDSLPRGEKHQYWGKKYTDEEKRFMSNITKGIPKSEEWKRKLSERRKGVKLSQATKDKISLSHTGMKRSMESRMKQSASMKGKKRGSRKIPKPCINCGRILMLRAHGKCSACCKYFYNHGVDRTNFVRTDNAARRAHEQLQGGGK